MKSFLPLPRRYVWAILSLAFVAWYPTLRLGFIADDPFLILSDPTIRQNGWSSLYSDFGRTETMDANPAYYRPIQKMLIRLEFLCFGLHPAGYHGVNLCLHAGNSLLTAEMALALGFGAPAALVTGSLFAVSPIIVHDMIQATGSEPFAYFLLMASLLLLLRPGLTGYLSGLLMYGMALFTKESAVMIPFMYLLLVLLRPDLKIRRVIPLMLMPIPYWFLRHAHMGTASAIPTMSTLPFLFKAFPKIMLHYIALYFFPWPLQSWPPIARLSPFWPEYLIGALAVSWLAWKIMGRRGLYCLGWVVLVMLPKIPALMQNRVMMDHWVYGAALGLLLPVVLAGLALESAGPVGMQKGMRILLGVVLLQWGFLCHDNIHERRTDELNYRWTLRFYSPDFALYRLGIILLRSGRAEEAVTTLDRLSAQSPGQSDYENARALAYAHAGEFDRASELLQGILRRDPGYALARENLAMLRARQSPPSEK